MKKTLKVSVVVVLALLLSIVLGVGFFGGALIKQAINTAGPRLLGVPVSVQSAVLSPIRGQLKLKGLHVGNPKGYETSGIFDLDSLDIALDTASLFGKVVMIEEIRIQGPQITYERSLHNSNIGQLMDQLAPKKEVPDTPAPAKPKAEGGKKVVIRKLAINGAQVNVSVTALGGHAMILPLPPIRLTNIGGDDKRAKGVTFVEALSDILGAILHGVTDVVGGAGKLAVEGAKAVEDVATDSIKTIGTGAGKALGGVKNLIGLDHGEAKPAGSGK